MPEELEVFANDLLAFKLYFTGASALCFYDYLLTWSDEVEYVWKDKKKGLVFYLFLVNRYFALIFCVITLLAYFLPAWTFEVCNRFAVVEWLQALIVTITAEMMLLVRVYALTLHRPMVLGLLLIALAQVIVVLSAMSAPHKNGALKLPDIPIDPFHICILYSEMTMDIIYLSLSIVFDVIVFATTSYLTMNVSGRIFPKTTLLQTIQRDSLLYFCAILSGNLVWMLMVLFARPGIKFINAQPSFLLVHSICDSNKRKLTHSNAQAHIDNDQPPDSVSEKSELEKTEGSISS